MEDQISRLIKHYVFKYPYPETWWSKAHFDKRCTEISVAEQVIIRCIDAMYTKEPKEVISDYIWEIIIMRRDSENIKTIQMLNIMEKTLEDMYNTLS